MWLRSGFWRVKDARRGHRKSCLSRRRGRLTSASGSKRSFRAGSADRTIVWQMAASACNGLFCARRRSPQPASSGEAASGVPGGRADLALLEHVDELRPIKCAGGVRWCTVRSGTPAKVTEATARKPWRDPRTDAATLVWAMNQLAEGDGREAYGRLVGAAAVGERFGRSIDSAPTSSPLNAAADRPNGISRRPGSNVSAVPLRDPGCVGRRESGRG